jgi:aminoglycoside phosphotransferase (APT) family kinase protein
MIEPEKTIKQISEGLIAYLRAETGNPTMDYEEPPTQMQGGYETSTFRFKLRGASQALSSPLVLRLYPSRFGPDNALWESTIQNVLADQGYPVARVYWTCTDMSILGGAFFVMALLPGDLMTTAPFETIPGMMGTAHARLHNTDPEPVIRALQEQGFDQRRYRLSGRMDWLQVHASRHPWLKEGVDWLIENCPPEPTGLAVCHGDFHPLNILVQDGQVTGVLDWPGFIVADPVLDIANTVTLTQISAKHILGLQEVGPAVELYLDAYRAQRPLDLGNLDYYRARRCIHALWEGAGGQSVWQHPGIVQDLVATTQAVTGLRIEPQVPS